MREAEQTLRYFTKSASERKRADEILEAIRPVKGEMRAVNKCGDCGHLFGRRFIPYGLGHGMTMDACLCQMTARRPFSTVAESRP